MFGGTVTEIVGAPRTLKSSITTGEDGLLYGAMTRSSGEMKGVLPDLRASSPTLISVTASCPARPDLPALVRHLRVSPPLILPRSPLKPPRVSVGELMLPSRKASS